MAQAVMSAIAEYEKLGAKVKEISLPNTALAVPTYYIIAPAECSANLSRLDGVRYGYRCENPEDLHDLYVRSRSEGFGAEVKRRIMLGLTLSAGSYDLYYKSPASAPPYQKRFCECLQRSGRHRRPCDYRPRLQAR